MEAKKVENKKKHEGEKVGVYNYYEYPFKGETITPLRMQMKINWIDPESHIDWDKEVYYILYQRKKSGMMGNGKFKKIKKTPRVVVCLLRDEMGNVARGVAICSLSDKFDLEEGKQWAYGYAVDAMIEEGNMNLIVRDRSQYVLKLTRGDSMFSSKFRYHSSYFENFCGDLRDDDDEFEEFEDFELQHVEEPKKRRKVPYKKKGPIKMASVKLSLKERGMLHVAEVVS